MQFDFRKIHKAPIILELMDLKLLPYLCCIRQFMGLQFEATNSHLDRVLCDTKGKKDIHHTDGMFCSSQEGLTFKFSWRVKGQSANSVRTSTPVNGFRYRRREIRRLRTRNKVTIF